MKNYDKVLSVLEKAGYSFEYNSDEETTVFQKENSDQYMTGEIYEDGCINMSLHSSFFNDVPYVEDEKEFVKSFEETFNRLVEEYGEFE